VKIEKYLSCHHLSITPQKTIIPATPTWRNAPLPSAQIVAWIC